MVVTDTAIMCTLQNMHKLEESELSDDYEERRVVTQCALDR